MSDIDVFISYKREEQSLALQVSQALKEAGYVAVTDLNIQKATDFGEAIDRKIQEAKVVVVLWTQGSVASDWVRKEANEAERLGKYYGVRLGAITADDLPFQVRTIDWRDLSETGLAAGMPDLVGDVTRLIGRAKLSDRHAEEASQQAEKDLEFYQVVSEIGDVGGFKKYLQLYPQGAYVDDAKAKIEGITNERDQEAYKDAKEMAAVGGYRRYLDRFPNGAFADDARDFIRRNSGWRSMMRKIPVFSIITAIGTGVGAYVALVPRQTDVPEKTAIEDLSQENFALQNSVRTLGMQNGLLEKRLADLQSQRQDITDQFNAKRAADVAKLLELDVEVKELRSALSTAQQTATGRTEKFEKLQGDLSVATEEQACAVYGAPGILIPQARFVEPPKQNDCVPLNVTKLILHDTGFEDTSLLSGLFWLEELNLSATSVSDISGLTDLTRLTSLGLTNTSVEDLEALSNSQKLQDLYLINTGIVDITALGSLSSLKRLWLRGAPVQDLDPLVAIYGLHFLQLPNGKEVGSKGWDSAKNRKEVREAIANWKPE